MGNVESLEESAMRDSYEEAGILLTTGQQLETTEFEARKAKMKRLEREKSMKQINPILHWKHNLERNVSRTSYTASSTSDQYEIPQVTCIHAIIRPFFLYEVL